MFLRLFPAACLLCIAGLAQTTIVPAPEDAYQIRYAANLNVGDSIVNVQNSGARGGPFSGGDICVNAYLVTPDSQLQACCSCRLAPNGLASWSVNRDLAINLLTPAVPTSATIKLLASAQTTCNASLVTQANLAPGLVAWGTTIHALPPAVPGALSFAYTTVETQFAKKPLSADELSKLTMFCGFIVGNGSGFGICKSCSLGGR
ncbi:MAG: hypothetical protein LAQ30_21940 [Acidobacteriia bacterium]|nr:hypothetical protein [Terriglobia bacterium]